MKQFGLVALACAIASPVVAQVSVETLLPQMVDLGRLARRPSPHFLTAQASSYDRASKNPQTDWFANADWGKYIGVEQREGRREYVMADLRGPGAVVRIWSANPVGTLRFYFDGESTPRFFAKTADLLTGKVAPFGDPFAYMSARGTNLYFPFPYQKSLKITVDDTDNNRAANMYYHVGYRAYDPGTMVKSFRMSHLEGLQPLMAKVKTRLLNPSQAVEGELQPATKAGLFTGKTAEIVHLHGPSEITEITMDLAPWNPLEKNSLDEWRLLRSVILEGWFDGEKCISVPLGDFFGTAPGLNDYLTVFTEVKGNRLVARFVMPFAHHATFRVTNIGPVAATLTTQLRTRPIVFDANTYHFKTQFGGEKGRTRPMRDMNFLTTTGEGAWVGSNLFVWNPVPGWWGEGDEKIWVDNDTFPSTFGTGTEDYYGYAWSNFEPYMKPYHAQPRCDGLAAKNNSGMSVVERWHVIDVMPFDKRFQFDMEMWHWIDTEAVFLHTAYWYARPGGPAPKPIPYDILLPRPITGPEPIKGAIEGEKLVIASKTGGTTEIQDFGGLSSGQQLWWRDANPGEKLSLKVRVPKAGKFAVSGNFCHARDYGIHKLTLNGQTLGDAIDFYVTGLEWKKRELGVVDLPAGEATLEVEVVGANSAAEKRHMFGLDYLLLEPR
ncbi:MAG: DUF2961 domain-containing protein [Fimbriimonadaceae bacterium]|nr:DUF2961 domain-containing protein [Fimbriimonadaceae bacterium]